MNNRVRGEPANKAHTWTAADRTHGNKLLEVQRQVSEDGWCLDYGDLASLRTKMYFLNN